MRSKNAQACIEGLRQAGLRLTPQRLAIVESIVQDETHPTAQALYERLHDRFPTLSVATVYNTLSALGGIQRCRKLEMGGASRFDPNLDPHDHAVCERCGKIRDVRSSSEPKPRGCGLPGFRVGRVERIYRGICAECAGAAG